MSSAPDSDTTLESTTLHICPPQRSCSSHGELHPSESRGDAFFALTRGEAVTELVSSELRVPPPTDGGEPDGERCFSPGHMVELQVSLSQPAPAYLGSASLGSALGILGEPSSREAAEMVLESPSGGVHLEPAALRRPLKQLGVVVGRAEALPEHPPGPQGRSNARVGGPELHGEEGGGGGGGGVGGGLEGDPGSFSVSSGIPSEEATPAEEQDSDSEGDPDQPHKHHARHASKCWVGTIWVGGNHPGPAGSWSLTGDPRGPSWTCRVLRSTCAFPSLLVLRGCSFLLQEGAGTSCSQLNSS